MYRKQVIRGQHPGPGATLSGGKHAAIELAPFSGVSSSGTGVCSLAVRQQAAGRCVNKGYVGSRGPAKGAFLVKCRVVSGEHSLCVHLAMVRSVRARVRAPLAYIGRV